MLILYRTAFYSSLFGFAFSVILDSDTEFSKSVALQERGFFRDAKNRILPPDDPAPEEWEDMLPQHGQEQYGIEQVIDSHPTWQTEPVPIVTDTPIGFERTVIYEPSAEADPEVIIGADLPYVSNAFKSGWGGTVQAIIFGSVRNSRTNARNEAVQGSTSASSRSVDDHLYTAARFQISPAESQRFLQAMRIAKSRTTGTTKRVSIIWNDQAVMSIPPNHIPDKRRDLNKRRSTARSPDTKTYVKLVPLKNPPASNDGGQARPAQIATLIDVSTSATASKRATSESVVQKIDVQAKSLLQKSPTSGTTQFLDTMAAFQSIQANISETIFPILIDMTSKTNCSLIFQAAWSIWMDLTSPSQIAIGPFRQGLHCLDQLEDYQAKQLDISTHDPAFQGYLAISAVLIDVYQDGWNRSFTAVNQTGLLNQLYTLSSDLLISSNNTIAPPIFRQLQNDTEDDAFFTNYNRNTDLDKLLA